MIETFLTVFPMAVQWCSGVTPTGADHSASKRNRERTKRERERKRDK